MNAPPFSGQTLLKIASTTCLRMTRTITATTGERSSGPNEGSRRRKRRRYGSQTSRREAWIRRSHGEDGDPDPELRTERKDKRVETEVRMSTKRVAEATGAQR